MFRDVFPILFSLADTFCQQIFDLSVDGPEIVLRPGCDRVIELFGQSERDLFVSVVCHVLASAPFPSPIQFFTSYSDIFFASYSEFFYFILIIRFFEVCPQDQYKLPVLTIG